MPTASMKPTSSLRDYQRFVAAVYGQNNERHYSVEEMLTNISRFAMRGLKGIRKGDDPEDANVNMVIALSWFMSLMNQLGVDLEDAVWNRDSRTCAHIAANVPVRLQSGRKFTKDRRSRSIKSCVRPKTIRQLQTMFDRDLSGIRTHLGARRHPSGGRSPASCLKPCSDSAAIIATMI
jgi:hypothetical protein